MSNGEQRKTGAGTVDDAKTQGTAEAKATAAKGPVAETQDIAKVGETVATVVAAKMQTMAVEAKGVVSEAQARGREAATAVAATMQSATAGLKDAVSEVQAGVVKARKVVKAESGAAKAKMKGIRRAAVAEARDVLADAKAKVVKVGKAVKGVVQKALGKKTKATRATPRKAAARVKKPFAAKRKISSRKLAGKVGVRKVARRTKR